jgi:hypothetical protein
MLEILAIFLESRLSREGHVLLAVMKAVIIAGLLIYFLNYLRLSYYDALSDAVNAVE